MRDRRSMTWRWTHRRVRPSTPGEKRPSREIERTHVARWVQPWTRIGAT